MSLKRGLTGFILAAITITAAITAAAFERPFPPDVKRGVFSTAEYPTVVIDGELRNLSANVQIRTIDNLIVMPAGLQVRSAIVNYTESSQGEIERVWLLTREEAAQPAPDKNK